jgi:CelD/BcsL family acetyltransferase involved in cellulose biosynthesis
MLHATLPPVRHSFDPSAAYESAHVEDSRLRTEVLDDAAAFASLEREWDALLDEQTKGTYFLRPHWNRLWWQHYAPRESSLHLVTCRTEDGRLVGVGPFYVKQLRVAGIPARELRFLGTGIALKTSESLDLVAKPGLEAKVGRAIAEGVKHDAGWDRTWFFQVPQDAEAMGHFARAMGPRMRTTACDRAPFIDTSVDWATLKAGYGRSMRRNIEYYSRRLFKTYPCEFRQVTAQEEVGPALDAMVHLHQTRWRRAGEAGAFGDRNFGPLLRAAAEQDLPSGRLRLWVLSIDGKIEGALLGLLDHGVLHYLQKGFNPEFAKDDLGTALLALCVKACVDDPAVRAFDLMGGGAPYKDMWARSATINVVSEMTRPNWRGRLLSGRDGLMHAARATYRTLTPTWLRTLRRERLRQTRRAQDVQAAGPADAGPVADAD